MGTRDQLTAQDDAQHGQEAHLHAAALTPPLDLEAYRARLGLREPADLAALHRAHVCAIPFENLDPQRGVPVSLATADLAAKLVLGGRGGYCFEHNRLFAAVLETLGFEVTPILARVRWGRPAGEVQPRTHLALRVSDGDRSWHADVGFGNGTLLEPIPFGPGGPHEQSGWRFRVTAEEDLLVLQAEAEGSWRDVYEFDPRPVPWLDVELANWFTATHPSSRFVTGLIIAAQRPDGTRLSLSDWGELALMRSTPSETSVTPVPRRAIPELLADHFGLPGFALAADGRIVPA